MDALTELCDIIVENPIILSEKLPWICQQCPQFKLLHFQSARVSRSHLSAVLAVARILAKNLDTTENHAKSVVLNFLEALRASFHTSFWPQSFTLESISAFYNSFLDYVSCMSLEFGTTVSELIEGAMNCSESDKDPAISRAFLIALSQNFPSIQESDGIKLITILLHQFAVVNQASIKETSDVYEGSRDSSFEEEYIESLEKQEIALKLVANILGKVKVDCELHDQVRSVAHRQLQSMSVFLKSRRWDLDKQDPVLKTRVNAQLFVYEAAARIEIESLLSPETDGMKKLVLEALTSLLNAAETCLTSIWWKMEACEQLFGSLLSGIAKIAVARGGQPLRLLFIRLKPLALALCAQPGTCARNQRSTFESVFETSCEIIESGWAKDRASVDTFIMGLASSICQGNDYQEQINREKQVPTLQLNVIQLLTDISVAVKKHEVADMIFPFFIKSLEEGDAYIPRSLRLQFLGAVSRIATLGFEKSYSVTVLLMTRVYLSEVSVVGSVESKTSAPNYRTEQLETLAAGFLTIASGLKNTKLRADYRHQLLSLCSDVGLVSESESGGSGADLLGPLLPAVAEICSDFEPTSNVEPSLLKLFRNLWFYIALFGLAPPILKTPLPEVKKNNNSVNRGGRVSTLALQAVGGPYMWNTTWALAVQRISQGSPPLVVSSVKMLEDELELNALHNSDKVRGTGNKKIALAQRTALSIALGGRVEISAMNTFSGVKATYLLAVAILEVLRFISNGGILNGGSSLFASRSAFSCIFEYLKSPSLTSAVSHCLTAIVHTAFEAAASWLEDRVSLTGKDASITDSTVYAHACFLIKSMSQRDEHIRNISVNLLIQIRDKFPQVLWSSSCLDSLLFSVHDNAPSTVVNDPAWTVAVRSLYQKVVREWIIISLSLAPCTTQGLLQDKLCKANTLERTQTTIDVVSLLTEIKIGTLKNESWSEMKTANIPAVMAAAASGKNLKASEAFNSEILGTSVVNAMHKCNHIGKIVGMLSLENSSGTGNHTLISNSVRHLQQFVSTAKKRGEVNKSHFREICSQATAILLSNLQAGGPKANVKDFSQLLRLLCWCPAYMLTPEALETGLFIWTWLVSAAPQMGSLVLAELVDAWIWTIDAKRGLFASDVRYTGPAAKLRPQLAPGEPEGLPETDHVDQIVAHRLWLGFLIDRYEVVRHNSVDQLLLFGRLLHRSTNLDWCFTHHPAATGTFFSLMLLGLKFCSSQRQGNMYKFSHGLQLLEDRIYRTSLGWFSRQPEWYDVNIPNFCQSEAQAVSVFAKFLSKEKSDVSQCDSKGRAHDNGDLINVTDQYHPVCGEMDNYAVGKEKRKQLLLMLCQHETDRLDVWAQPVSSKRSPYSQLKISSGKWKEHAKTAFSVDPRIAISLASRFPENIAVKTVVIYLVQAHVVDLHKIPEALPYFVTPKSVEENSVLLQQLPHFAACLITQALEFLTPAYKGHPRVMAYILRVLEFYPPEQVTFFMPQLVQSLRYDEGRLVEGYLLRVAQRSDIFAHILIWHLQGESAQEIVKDGASDKNASFQAILLEVRQHIIDGFTPKALDLFSREFDFFEKITSISGALFHLPKEERRAGIRRELEKITMEGEDLYLPTAPTNLVKGIQVDSGIPLQSAAKVPIMITFNVVDRDGNHNDVKPQACIFKVGDDCRQDVLALQVISLLRDIFKAVGLNLYLFPYGVLPTGAGRGIIECRIHEAGVKWVKQVIMACMRYFNKLMDLFGSPSFEKARHNFLTSLAGYAVASLLLQPKDRHNGNLLFDEMGRLVHIDFGFILGTSPGGNMRFESAHFKLSHEMTQLVDPSGVMKSETWHQFVSLCVKGYLAARRYMDAIISTVEVMVDSGLPCFSSKGDPIEKLRKRFHPEMTEREAARFMVHVCTDAYDKWTTSGYDLIQYLQQGIDK